MKNTMFIFIAAATLLLLLSCIKYYLYFMPRYCNVIIPITSAYIYKYTWESYCPANNIIGVLDPGTTTIIETSGFHGNDEDFFRIITQNNSSGYVYLHSFDFYTYGIIYQMKLTWYFKDFLSLGNIK